MKALFFFLIFSISASALAQESRPYQFTYDVGFSAGTVNDHSYSELNIGVNYFIAPWLAWRNAAFYRSIEPKSQYGLDTSLRLFGDLGSNQLGVTFFGGPGFRFITETKNAPFAEAGVVGRFGRLSLGAGVKTIFFNAVDSNLDQDTQIFLIIAGGGAF